MKLQVLIDKLQAIKNASLDADYASTCDVLIYWLDAEAPHDLESVERSGDDIGPTILLTATDDPAVEA